MCLISTPSLLSPVKMAHRGWGRVCVAKRQQKLSCNSERKFISKAYLGAPQVGRASSELCGSRSPTLCQVQCSQGCHHTTLLTMTPISSISHWTSSPFCNTAGHQAFSPRFTPRRLLQACQVSLALVSLLFTLLNGLTLRKTGGFLNTPTPGGVPVRMMSPG